MTPRCGTKTKLEFARHLPADRQALPDRIAYFHAAKLKLPGLSMSETASAIETAFNLAKIYVPIPFVRIRQAGDAMIRLRLGRPDEFDGLGGTLAMADVVSLYDRAPREIIFDPDEQWRMSKASEAAVYAIPVTCHEIGHTLGFGHWPKPGGLMSAYYSPNVTTPTPQEMKRFYREYPELCVPESKP